MLNLNNKFLEEVAGDYVMRDWESRCFKVNNFYLPKKIVTSNKNKISLERNRRKLLKQANSPYSRKMKDWLNEGGFNYVQEFIIIVENKDLWNDIINTYDFTDEEREKYKSMNYFSLDFLLLNSLTCIEIDSNYHNNKKLLDQARDVYIELYYEIKTIRLFHFGDDPAKDKIGIDEIKRRESLINVNPYEIFGSYYKTIISSYLYENEYLITILDRFISFESNCKRMYYGFDFVITGKDYEIMAQGINFGAGIDPIIFYEDFTNLAKELLNINITVCKNIRSYSINDIYLILYNRDNPDIIRKYVISSIGYIPYWITEIINIPEDYICYIGNQVGEDYFILNYIKIGIIK